MRYGPAIRSSSASRSASGWSSRSTPSTSRTSKKYGCSTCSRGASAPNLLIVSWNARGRASASRASDSPSSTNDRAGNVADHVDHLGQPVRDVGKVAREDPDLVAVAVHLDPGAVELVLDRCRGRSRRAPPRPRSRSTRASAAPGAAPRAGSCRSASLPPSSASSAVRAEVAGQHVRAAGEIGRHVGRDGDRLDQHAVERALAQLAHEHAADQLLLVARSPGRGDRRGSPSAWRRSRCRSVAATASSAASSSATVIDAVSAGGGSIARSVDQPTPMRPWRGAAMR